MFSAYSMVPGRSAVSGRELYDIDSVFFRVSKSRVKNWEVQAQRRYTNYKINRKTQVIGIFSTYQDFPFFETRFTNSEKCSINIA